MFQGYVCLKARMCIEQGPVSKVYLDDPLKLQGPFSPKS